MVARNSEIRSYLLRFAEKKGIRIKEYISEGPRTGWFCHLEGNGRTSTAVSYEGHDNALVMAFLSFVNPSVDFIPENL